MRNSAPTCVHGGVFGKRLGYNDDQLANALLYDDFPDIRQDLALTIGNICTIIGAKAEGISLMDKESIRELRRKLGLSQEGLARKLGVSVLTVRRWEKGSFRPSPLAMARIEKIAQKISRGD